jgi:DNA primase
VLVEGLMDVHHLRGHGYPPVVAAGSARVSAPAIIRLDRHGVEAVVVAFDNDTAGRDGIARAIEDVSRAPRAPILRIVEPSLFGGAKDPDGFVRDHGIVRFRELVEAAACAVSWRAVELIGDVTPDDPAVRRREALGSAGGWLGSLPARLSLEQEDAIRHVADRCGYSHCAVERAFRARYWAGRARRTGLVMER